MATEKLKSESGATHNRKGRFESLIYEYDDPSQEANSTRYIPVQARTIVNQVTSPDLGFFYSANPYQGCAHGCTYCYARNTHPYWGYSAGRDFENVIMVKENAVKLLHKKLNSKSWKPQTIMLSGNTDCYQPAEAKFHLTQGLLKALLLHRNPGGVITKNALIRRDIDILYAMAEKNLINVVISITTINEDLRRKMEPKTATFKQRIENIRLLHERKIPVMVLIAPVIPSLNDTCIPEIMKAAADAGAHTAGYQVVRLNGEVGPVFSEWIKKAYPDKAERVLNQIATLHGGKINDSKFGRRLKGEGEWSDMIAQQFNLYYKKYFTGQKTPVISTSEFRRYNPSQPGLFDEDI